MVETPELATWLLAWLACAAFVIVGQRRDGSGAGLVISYVLQLWVLHWLAGAMYVLPWYWHADLPLLYGIKEGTYAIAGFAIGSTVVVPYFLGQLPKREPGAGSEILVNPKLVNTYLVVGAFTYYVLEPILHPIPTVGAIAGATSNLILVAIGMGCWNGFHSSGADRRSFWRWVAIAACLPVASVATKGFLGYGFSAMLTALSFVASFYRPRWKIVLCCSLVGYLALSVYVTYMRDRPEIRASVWGEEAYSNRFSTIQNTVYHPELFDPTNDEHLRRIDDRLNQGELVGIAVANLETHPESFANGRTIWEGVLSLVPRILWPDKPMIAGSADLVSEFTGLHFMGDTSVGIGHVLEWYANFGSLGVFFGMMSMGILVGWTDRQAAIHLFNGNWSRFTRWWLPGVSLLTVGGSLVDTFSSAGAGLVVAVLVEQLPQVQFASRQKHPRTPVLPKVEAAK